MADEKRKSLSPEQVVKMIKEWDQRTPEGFAEEFGVSKSTILNMARVARKKNNEWCKPKGQRRRTDILEEAEKLMKTG